jgi:hypothetical protein
VPTLRGIDNRSLSLRAWLHERVGVILRRLRVRADPVVLPPPPFLQMTLRARSAARAESILRLDADYAFESYAERRALYTDFLTGFLVPRTTIWSGGDLLIRTNSVGCRGDELEAGKPVIAFFGDSTTLGVIGTSHGPDGSSWTEHVDLPGYAVLNAGVEGLQMATVARRYESVLRNVPLVCAVFYTGWHNLIYNERSEEYWERCLRSYLSREHITVLCTLPSPLLPEMRRRGIIPLLNEQPEAAITDVYFNFWGEWDPSVWLEEILDAHERFNAYLLDFCRRTETPLIDLRGFMYPDDYETATREFFDICHFRPRVYSKVGSFMSDELRRILPTAPPSVDEWQPPEAAEPEPVEDLRRNIYPIW